MLEIIKQIYFYRKMKFSKKYNTFVKNKLNFDKKTNILLGYEK